MDCFPLKPPHVMARSPKNAPAHAITDAYIDRLALALDDRLLDGATFTEALSGLLRDEAPVTFYDPEQEAASSGSALLKTLLGLGLLAAAGYGLNALLKQQTGKGAAPFAREPSGRQHAAASSGTAAYASPALHDDPEEGFRAHHRSTYSDTGRDFAHYEPAYRHAHAYGTSEQHRTKNYDALEPEIRRTYEEEHGAGTFDEVRGATRHAFERGRAQHVAAAQQRADGPTANPRAGSAETASNVPSSASGEEGFEEHAEDFRSHYQNAYNDTDRAFDDYKPAYRLGFRYGADDEHRTRDFEALEPEMHRTYEEEHGENTFRSVEGAARHAFHRARTARAQA